MEFITTCLMTLIIWGFMHLYHRIIMKMKTDGIFQIDHSNPDKDICRLEINDLDKIERKKRIVLKVDNNADLSQK